MKSQYCTDEYEQRMEIVPKRMYWDQCSNSKKRGHNAPEYTKQELYDWVISQSNYKQLYLAWKDAGYQSDMRPSVDRIDNTKGYMFSNIELVTFKENKKRANYDSMYGDLDYCRKPVYQYDGNGNFVAEHISQAEAERTVPNVDQRNISACCRGKLGQTGGFRWSFKKYNKIAPYKIPANWMHSPIFQYNAFTGELHDIYPNYTYIDDKTEYTMESIRLAGRLGKAVYGSVWSTEELDKAEAIKHKEQRSAYCIVKLDSDRNIIHVEGSVREMARYVCKGQKWVSRRVALGIATDGYYFERQSSLSNARWLGASIIT